MTEHDKKFFSLLLSIVLDCGAVSVAHAESASIHTRGGNEFDILVSTYRYDEPTLDVATTGDKFGVGHTGALKLNGDWFIKDDAKFVYGKVDYVGSGFQINAPDWYYEVRGLVGRDVQVGSVMLSPYVGIGYRYLFNDLRGYSSTGAVGYRRESNYLYVPMGVTHRFLMQDSAVLATTFEYDYFVQGKQFSRLSDTGIAGYPDVTNNQNSGFGFRADVMYTMSDWAFGPFFNVWNVNDSDMVLGIGLEPRNRTTEFGMRIKFRF